MIDTLGGIDVSVPAAFWAVPAGNERLDGETTWRYVSAIPRPGIPDELPRIERQKHVLKALQAKLLSASTLPKIPELLTGFVAERGIKTDLSGGQILYLIGVLENTSLDDISIEVIPGNATPGQADQPQLGKPVTLLVLGIGQWAGENEAEAIYVVEVDPSGQTVGVTGFAPSLEVDVAGLEDTGITRTKLKMVYHHGLELPGADEISAASLVGQALVDNFGITPDHYIVAQEDYLASMIDTLGGIDVNVLATFGDMPPGEHHLDGVTTWRYVGHIPQPGIPEELPRIERQKHVLKALRDKLLSASTLPKIPELLTGFVVHRGIKTDLSGRQILYLIGVLESTSLDDISFTVFPES